MATEQEVWAAAHDFLQAAIADNNDEKWIPTQRDLEDLRAQYHDKLLPLLKATVLNRIIIDVKGSKTVPLELENVVSPHLFNAFMEGKQRNSSSQRAQCLALALATRDGLAPQAHLPPLARVLDGINDQDNHIIRALVSLVADPTIVDPMFSSQEGIAYPGASLWEAGVGRSKSGPRSPSLGMTLGEGSMIPSRMQSLWKQAGSLWTRLTSFYVDPSSSKLGKFNSFLDKVWARWRVVVQQSDPARDMTWGALYLLAFKASMVVHAVIAALTGLPVVALMQDREPNVRLLGLSLLEAVHGAALLTHIGPGGLLSTVWISGSPEVWNQTPWTGLNHHVLLTLSRLPSVSGTVIGQLLQDRRGASLLQVEWSKTGKGLVRSLVPVSMDTLVSGLTPFPLAIPFSPAEGESGRSWSPTPHPVLGNQPVGLPWAAQLGLFVADHIVSQVSMDLGYDEPWHLAVAGGMDPAVVLGRGQSQGWSGTYTGHGAVTVAPSPPAFEWSWVTSKLDTNILEPLRDPPTRASIGGSAVNQHRASVWIAGTSMSHLNNLRDEGTWHEPLRLNHAVSQAFGNTVLSSVVQKVVDAQIADVVKGMKGQDPVFRQAVSDVTSALEGLPRLTSDTSIKDQQQLLTAHVALLLAGVGGIRGASPLLHVQALCVVRALIEAHTLPEAAELVLVWAMQHQWRFSLDASEEGASGWGVEFDPAVEPWWSKHADGWGMLWAALGVDLSVFREYIKRALDHQGYRDRMVAKEAGHIDDWIDNWIRKLLPNVGQPLGIEKTLSGLLKVDQESGGPFWSGKRETLVLFSRPELDPPKKRPWALSSKVTGASRESQLALKKVDVVADAEDRRLVLGVKRLEGELVPGVKLEGLFGVETVKSGRAFTNEKGSQSRPSQSTTPSVFDTIALSPFGLLNSPALRIPPTRGIEFDMSAFRDSLTWTPVSDSLRDGNGSHATHSSSKRPCYLPGMDPWDEVLLQSVEQQVWESEDIAAARDATQSLINFVGMSPLPGLGFVMDLLNATLYWVRGMDSDAAQVLAMAPLGLIPGGKLASKTGKGIAKVTSVVLKSGSDPAVVKAVRKSGQGVIFLVDKSIKTKNMTVFRKSIKNHPNSDELKKRILEAGEELIRKRQGEKVAEVATEIEKVRAAVTPHLTSTVFKSRGQAADVGMKKLGANPVQVEPGKWRSADGRWQFRAKAKDIADKHVHIERLDEFGWVIENWHLRW